MLALNNVSVYFGAEPLFSDISLRINPKERIALAGRNGAGKTTMLNIISKRLLPTEGSISHPTDMTIGYLPQHLLTKDERTVREEVRLAFGRELEIKRTVDALTEELASRTDYESEGYMELIQRLANHTELLAMYSSDRREAEIEKTLKGLGFVDTDFERQTSEFSGGWRMRVELAKILLSRPDLLLLDEPTNHLDMESIIWLEGFLKSTSAAVVMVSHDRKFLDNTTTRTIELSLGKAYDYKASYSHYLTLREERYQQQLRAYENQQKMIKDTEDFIERFRYKATKSVQVQSRIKQLEKVERIEVEEIDRRRIHFRFPMAVPSGAYPVIVEGLSVSYGDLNVLKDIELTIERGDKIALVGKNGSGKTTFVRAVMGEIPYEGTIREGHQVEVSYFAQNQASLLDPNKTIFQTIDDVAVGDIRTRINDILGAFMFGGEISEKKVQVLSGGERSRLAMIRLLLSPSNVLILDEPTNHLDISSKEVLKEAIRNYEGTVLIVSHDRDFLEGLVDKAIEFKDKKIINYLGGMPDYFRALSLRNEDNKVAPPPKVTTTEESIGKTDYVQQKEQQKALRKLRQQVEQCEKKISEVEQEISDIEEKMSQGDTSSSLIYRYDELQKLHADLMSEWEESQEQLENN
ncbi:ABC-F family ATP-binding cassette domain-containing protein [Porphyromonas cangingivalis]|uniref:ABC-F family ATP-binding cassette domain-containing protein n=1 Tax=Porphyromonas cangingivalis TaxID=36874 RepID=UPI00051D210B|nr:ABC-F family ATP-binding cassette domain-containing protein [Porphyromonas cangingivalis]KGL47714.1 glycosyl transferase family 2 [Porphyromonas cangingivalis]